MKIPRKTWNRFVGILRKLTDNASKAVREYIETHTIETDEDVKALIDYAYAIATRYGEGASAMACEYYDALAELAEKTLPSAVPAPTASYADTAKAVNGARLQSQNPEVIASAVGRLVKQTGVDTTVFNAIRDGAEYAWIPNGDTCAFCMMLASNGWQKASKNALKNGHAKHIHVNCDCTYAVRFDTATEVEGYDPGRYYEMYRSADGATSAEKINAMRREFYAKNKDRINAQKRSAYAKRKELNSSEAEEIDID